MKTHSNVVVSVRAAVSAGLLATAAAAHAQPLKTIYVDASAPVGGNGLSWNTAFNDLQDALTTSLHPNTEIRISRGWYFPDRGTGDRARSFVLASATTLTLLGGFAGRQAPNPDLRNPQVFETILSGDLQENDPPYLTGSDNSFTVVQVREGAFQATIDGLTIRGGRADATVASRGGGMRVVQSIGRRNRLLVRGCTFSGNYASYGGAAIDVADGIEIESCSFIRNSVPTGFNGGYGGAIALSERGARATIRGTTFDENTAYVGGAISMGVGDYANLDQSLSIERCIFGRNNARFGGAIEMRTVSA